LAALPFSEGNLDRVSFLVIYLLMLSQTLVRMILLAELLAMAQPLGPLLSLLVPLIRSWDRYPLLLACPPWTLLALLLQVAQQHWEQSSPY
jgi:hypothetical protein